MTRSVPSRRQSRLPEARAEPVVDDPVERHLRALRAVPGRPPAAGSPRPRTGRRRAAPPVGLQRGARCPRASRPSSRPARPRRARRSRRARSSATTTVSSSAAPRAIWKVSRSVRTCVVAETSLPLAGMRVCSHLDVSRGGPVKGTTTLELPRTADSAGIARLIVTAHGSSLSSERLKSANVMVSELVSNAFRHGEGADRADRRVGTRRRPCDGARRGSGNDRHPGSAPGERAAGASRSSIAWPTPGASTSPTRASGSSSALRAV